MNRHDLQLPDVCSALSDIGRFRYLLREAEDVSGFKTESTNNPLYGEFEVFRQPQTAQEFTNERQDE